eukprot:TRINITY_DN7437_c0_g1_i1.p1 TRINITY_DN7437_c0_g1~~TRINITY_DN7437_c0_g1_i1.p1  ORF type:complete len:409 (+),score=130.55 TRINITY_DN7437_c0_g1_i1:90-1229(+)
MAVKPTSVADLTAKNIDSVLDGNSHVLVYFGAPWCQHCTELSTVYQNVANTYSAYTNVQIVKVNVDNEPELVKAFNVKLLPTILLFQAGQSRSDSIEYPGDAERTTEDIVDFVNHYIGFEVEAEKEHDFVSKFDIARYEALEPAKNKYTFVMFHAPWCAHCHAVNPIWDRIGTVFAPEADISIAKIDVEEGNNVELVEKLDITAFPTIMVFGPSREYLHEGKPYDGPNDFLSLLRMVNHYGHAERAVNGQYLKTYGRSEEFDEEAEFFVTQPSNRDVIIERTQKMVDAITSPKEQGNAQVYVNIMKMTTEKGDDWLAEEGARLDEYLHGLSKVNLGPYERDVASLNKNVLSAFLEVTGEEENKLKNNRALVDKLRKLDL